MNIQDANQLYLIRKMGGYRAFIARETMARWGQAPDWEIDSSAAPLEAFVNRGVWAVKCECGEAWAVSPGEPGYCPNCCNAIYGGKSREVIFPGQETKAEVEAILALRAYPQNRNWRAPETPADLRAENAAHPHGLIKGAKDSEV